MADAEIPEAQRFHQNMEAVLRVYPGVVIFAVACSLGFIGGYIAAFGIWIIGLLSLEDITVNAIYLGIIVFVLVAFFAAGELDVEPERPSPNEIVKSMLLTAGKVILLALLLSILVFAFDIGSGLFNLRDHLNSTILKQAFSANTLWQIARGEQTVFFYIWIGTLVIILCVELLTILNIGVGRLREAIFALKTPTSLASFCAVSILAFATLGFLWGHSLANVAAEDAAIKAAPDDNGGKVCARRRIVWDGAKYQVYTCDNKVYRIRGDKPPEYVTTVKRF